LALQIFLALDDGFRFCHHGRGALQQAGFFSLGVPYIFHAARTGAAGLGVFDLCALACFGRLGQILVQFVHKPFDDVALLFERIRLFFRQYVEVLFTRDMDDIDQFVLALDCTFDGRCALVIGVLGRWQALGRRQLQRRTGLDVVGVGDDRIQGP
jgi:hypothetical protein